jgi:hypothetical protein
MKIIKNWVIMKGSDEERDKEGKVIGIWWKIECMLEILLKK